MKYRVLRLAASIFLSVAVSAAATAFRDSSVFRVHFRQGSSSVEAAYGCNPDVLDSIAGRVRVSGVDGSRRFLRIEAGASPEGSREFNRRLAAARASSVMAYVRTLADFPDSLAEVVSDGVDWAGLERLVEDCDGMPCRTDVLAVLREMPADERLRAIKALCNGRPYRYMYDNLFPALRGASVGVYEVPVPGAHTVRAFRMPQTGIGIVLPKGTDIRPATVSAGACHPPAGKPFYMALKTNMLYDALLVPNVGAEFYVGGGWTVGGGWMYAWWKKGDAHRYWRIYGGELAVRRYFGRRAAEKPLTGHHAGVYGQMLTYDFQNGGRGYMGGVPGGTLFEKANYAAGLEYGYSLPVGRRLNIDFTIGVGYMWGRYMEYRRIDDCDVWQSTRRRRWFGPTKAEISLVWLLGRDNYNKGKGGGR